MLAEISRKKEIVKTFLKEKLKCRQNDAFEDQMELGFDF